MMGAMLTLAGCSSDVPMTESGRVPLDKHRTEKVASRVESTYNTTGLVTHRVRGYGDIMLQVYTIAPTGAETLGKRFPLVVFSNSWATAGEEYGNIASDWAAEGYIVVEYVARGWFLSGGLVDVVGPDNCRDASMVLDWALEEFRYIVSPSKIAMGGVSYGAVIAQLTAAHDRRIRAVLALSGTSDALADLYWHRSVPLFWGQLLVSSGALPLVARESKNVSKIWNDLLEHKNMDEVTRWASQRSMTHVMDAIRENNPAIYMSHNHDD
eukprot:COSAG02_NODE_13559_length_1379_cov_1.150781_2_plen_267_part_01